MTIECIFDPAEACFRPMTAEELYQDIQRKVADRLAAEMALQNERLMQERYRQMTNSYGTSSSGSAGFQSFKW